MTPGARAGRTELLVTLKGETMAAQPKRKLTLVHRMQYLGGQYMFGQGFAALGEPVMYISVAYGKSGLTIPVSTLRAFHIELGRAIEMFKPLGYNADGEGTQQPAEDFVSTHSQCPSATDEAWRAMTKASGNDPEQEATMLRPHGFQPVLSSADGAETSECKQCGYDEACVQEYTDWAKAQSKPRRRGRKS